MTANRFPILSRRKENIMFQAAPEDFKRGNATKTVADIILNDPRWSLYCLDLEKRESVFVRTPASVDLTQAPFLFQEQFHRAEEVLSVDFETFHQLAATIRPEASNVIFVHSVGRCGSTLMSRVFSALPETCSLSEPDPATQLTEWRGRRFLPEDELRRLAESATRFSCKPWPARGTDTRWAFKYRAQCIEIADWLMQAFPKAKQLFIKRQPLSWLESAFRVFVDTNQIQDPVFMALFEEVWCRYLPLIRRKQVPSKAMSVSKTWMYIWIGVRETQNRLKRRGLRFFELDYETLKANPEPTLRDVFAYCGIPVADWTPIRACLQKDSQAGTVAARSSAKNPKQSIPDEGLAEAIALLKEWGYSTSYDRDPQGS